MKTTQQTKTTFDETQELKERIGSLETARAEPVFVMNENQAEYQAIYNEGTERVASIVSKHYKIIQHNDVLQAVYETLNRLNLDVSGLIVESKNKARFDFVFKDKEPIKDDASGVMLGFRATNSYNKSCSFKLEMYGYRVICKNGMSLGKVMNNVKEITFHVGEEKHLEIICKKVELFIKDVIDSSDKLQEYVNRAIGDSIEWEMMDKIIDKLTRRKKHRIEIRSRLLSIENPTRWDLYNAVTSYITHGEHLTPNVQSFLEKKAERILVKNSEGLVVLQEVEE